MQGTQEEIDRMLASVQEAAYKRGRHDALEEIAKTLFPPDGLDDGSEPAFEVSLIQDFPPRATPPTSLVNASVMLNAITALIRQERRK